MSNQAETNLVIADIDIRMMAGPFRRFTYLIDKLRAARKSLWMNVLVNSPFSMCQAGRERRRASISDWGNAGMADSWGWEWRKYAPVGNRAIRL